MRVRTALVVALGGLLIAPAAAQASCVARKPVDQLKASNVAFVGRLVARDYARMTFEVDQVVKGALGKRVTVRDDGFLTSVGYSAPEGRRVGLVLRVRNGAFVANDCDRVAIRALRAAARRSKPCPDLSFPAVKVVKLVGLIAQLEIASKVTEGRLNSFVIRWGDGSRRTVRLKGRSARRSVRHQYREPGTKRGSVVVTATPRIECGRADQSPPTLVQLRFR